METAYKTALLAAGALIAYRLFASGKTMKSLRFFPKKVYDIKMEGITPVLKLGLGVQNISNESLELKSLIGNVFCNDIEIGRVNLISPTKINASSETILILSVRLSLLGIVQDLIKAFKGGGWKKKIVIKAMANVDRWNIPINVSYTIG
jgi:LEA14-like dessication related protein